MQPEEHIAMANLRFQSVPATGSRELGGAKGPGGAGMFDLFFENIELPGFVVLPALIVLAAGNVELEKSFITVNAPTQVNRESFDEVSGTGCSVWPVLPNPSATWILQMHRINQGKLTATGNVLGIHTRNDNGEQARIRDSFAVARIFLAC
jgi:hypothetical protein